VRGELFEESFLWVLPVGQLVIVNKGVHRGNENRIKLTRMWRTRFERGKNISQGKVTMSSSLKPSFMKESGGGESEKKNFKKQKSRHQCKGKGEGVKGRGKKQ